jgi:hypothetical protein
MSILVVAIATIVIASAAAAAVNVVYAQNKNTTTMLLQTNHNNTTVSIKELNASIITDAINAKIRSIYGGGEEEGMPTITKIRH